MPRWDQARALDVLREARAKATGAGLSDRSLARSAALHDDDAAMSRAAFKAALHRAGWGRRRIDRALAEVDGRHRTAMVLPQPPGRMAKRATWGSRFALILDERLARHGVLLGAVALVAGGFQWLGVYAATWFAVHVVAELVRRRA